MADYHPLITRAVTALEKDTAEHRRALYERARSALVAQLRGTTPSLDEAEITRERLALEEAIRKVEVESARRAREAPRTKSTTTRTVSTPTTVVTPDFRETFVKREEPVKAAPPPPSPVPPRPAVTPAIVSQPVASESTPVTKTVPIDATAREEPVKTVPAQPPEEPKFSPLPSVTRTDRLEAPPASGDVKASPAISPEPPTTGPAPANETAFDKEPRAKFGRDNRDAKSGFNDLVATANELVQGKASKKTPAADSPKPSSRENEPNQLLDEALREFRQVVGNSNRPTEEALAESSPPPPPKQRPSVLRPATIEPNQFRPGNRRLEPPPPIFTPPLQPTAPPSAEPPVDPFKSLDAFDPSEPSIAEENWRAPAETVRTKPRFNLDDGPPTNRRARRRDTGGAQDGGVFEPYPPLDERVRPPGSLRSYRRNLWALFVFVIISGCVMLAYYKGADMTDSVRALIASWRSQSQQVQRETPQVRPKDPARVGQPDNASSSSANQPSTQRAMLTTEPDAANPRGRDFVGRAAWKTETIPAAAGRPAEVAIKLEVEIPDRGFAMTWLIRRNTDATLPASHTIDIEFNLAPNSPLGRVAEIKSMLMKQPGQVEGSPLWGHAQRSTPTYFLVGLSAVEADAQYNLKLLKEQPAFDVALIFSNVGRAFLLIEKGPAGEKVFAEAFAAWKQ